MLVYFVLLFNNKNRMKKVSLVVDLVDFKCDCIVFYVVYIDLDLDMVNILCDLLLIVFFISLLMILLFIF